MDVERESRAEVIQSYSLSYGIWNKAIALALKAINRFNPQLEFIT